MPSNSALDGKSRLADNRVAVGSAVELLRIPHIDVLRADDESTAEVVERIKHEFIVMLGEVHQIHRALLLENHQVDISVELTWLSVPTEGQAHDADIRLMFVHRVVSPNEQLAERVLDELNAVIAAALAGIGVDSMRLAFAEYQVAMDASVSVSALALEKEERLDDLKNPVVPTALVFGRFPDNQSDLSRIASTLVRHPHCSVSFVLVPTQFTSAEEHLVASTSTSLRSLASGVTDPMMGQVSVVPAARAADQYEYYERNKNGPLFELHTVIAGPPRSVSVLASRVHGHLADGQNPTDLSSRTFVLPPGSWQKSPSAAPWLIAEIIAAERIARGLTPASLARLPSIVTAQEAGQVYRTPIASQLIGAGFKVNRTRRGSRAYSEGVVESPEVEAGLLNTSHKSVSIGFSKRDLTKHMFIVGTPGSGKTTFALGMLDRLWKEHGIPFLVIEPAKAEYRALLHSIPELQVFTPGNSSVSPFVMNPFIPPKNVPLESYKATLKTAFAAGVTMLTPLDRIFEEAVELAYSKAGWMDHYTSDSGGQVISIHDFLAAFRATFDGIGYTGDAENIGRAGLVRLAAMERLFDTYKTIPVEDLLSQPTLIELSAIENSEAKSLLIALLLLQILAYVNHNVVGDGNLRNLLLLEEAHVLLGAESGGVHLADADPTSIAKGLLKRMLAEIRSAGVGVIVADQSARAVGLDVIALTNVKMAFRLVESVDREIVAASTNMSAIEQQRLSRLRPGEALLFYDRLDDPEEIITADYRAANDIPISLPNSEVAHLVRYWDSHADLLRPYPECDFLPTFDPALQPAAKEIASRVFREHIDARSFANSDLQSLWPSVRDLIRQASPPELAANPKVNDMARMNLLRFILQRTGARVSASGVVEALALSDGAQGEGTTALQP